MTQVLTKSAIYVEGFGTLASGATGTLKNVRNSIATVSFRLPVQPEECEKCGRFMSLSRNAATGEIECMAMHCGHSHGFEAKEAKVHTSRLALVKL